ncbi:DUF1190 domain-containing protein [Skermanella sp. TT6]|uniref:DUF1190 domain-containing protein n=1 Tax=Skermanella cutis TaxID=2775420 RepID=A0ABX7B809_9PROT|nr:DUF1190 domain-containing protein [Skermanella sp. TT6]QQP90274.1 DUF1190 domain-containing protein [Skermanella sp. TT6]
MKRSRRIKLTMLGASAIVLTACEERVETQVYETVEQCLANVEEHPDDCRRDFESARAAHAEAAPRYASRADCEAEFGDGRCEAGPTGQQAEAGQGGSFFMPVMMGYMLGNALGRTGVAAQPLYRPLVNGTPGSFRTPGNVDVGSSVGRTSVRPAAVNAPVANAGQAVSRGGFGARGAATGTAGG